MPHVRTSRTAHSAFTLIELLVSIAVIAILISILLPALGHARECALFTGELSIARQFGTAHRMYADDHKQFLMPGYPNQQMIEARREVIARFRDGTLMNGEQAWQDIARYSWRLLPYFEYDLNAMFSDFDEISALFGNDRSLIVHQTAIAPRMGLNQVFVGGSADTDGTGSAFLENPNNAAAVASRWGARWFARRTTDVRNQSSLIVFASSQQPGAVSQSTVIDGYYKILPPSFMNRRWRENPPDSSTSPIQVGFVSFSLLNKSTAAMMDGHADGLTWEESNDMRRWSPQAKSPDFVLPSL